MPTFSNIFKKTGALKLLAAGSVIAVLFVAFVPAAVPQAHAQLDPFGIGDIVSSVVDTAIGGVGDLVAQAILGIIGTVIAKGVYIISYIIVYIFSILIGLAAWGTGVLLDINAGVINSTAVQVGFSVTSAIANLGFVVAITVIGIATILRREQYGMKQTLWKLITAAILINFSLVIVAPILGLSNQFTNYFLNCATPGLGCGQSAGGYIGFNQFAGTLAGAFNPQKNLLFINTDLQTLSPDISKLQGALSGVAEAFGRSLAPVTSLVFVAGMLVVFTITLATLNLMLLIRYVTLGILLILMPFIWLMWIFPNLKEHWTAWWSKFLHWVFFPPLVVFFLYLAIVVSGAMGDADYFEGPRFAEYAKVEPVRNSIFSAVVGALGDTFKPLISNMLQGFMVVGLAVGGMFAAHKLSITGASAALGAMKNVKSWATGAMKRAAGAAGGRARDIAMNRLRTAGRQTSPTGETTTALQRFGSRLQGIPGFGGVGATIARQGAPASEDKLKTIEEYRKENLAPLDNRGVLTRAASPTAFVDPATATAIGQELGKRYSKFSAAERAEVDRLLPQFLQASDSMGAAQTILNARPDLAVHTSAATPKLSSSLGRMETQAEANDRATTDAVKGIKGADIEKLSHAVVGDYRSAATVPTNPQMNVVLTLSNSQLAKLGAEGTVEQTEAVRNTLRQTLDRYTAGTLPLSTEQLASLTRIESFLTKSPNWQAI